MSNLWSVAQACVWAATRDHIAVKEVRPRAFARCRFRQVVQATRELFGAD